MTLGNPNPAFVDHMTGLATEEAETLVHATLMFLWHKLAIATELFGQFILFWCCFGTCETIGVWNVHAITKEF